MQVFTYAWLNAQRRVYKVRGEKPTKERSQKAAYVNSSLLLLLPQMGHVVCIHVFFLRKTSFAGLDLCEYNGFFSPPPLPLLGKFLPAPNAPAGKRMKRLALSDGRLKRLQRFAMVKTSKYVSTYVVCHYVPYIGVRVQ